MIYLDNAATTLYKPQEVIDAVVNAMQHMGNSSRGTHSQALEAAGTVYHARVKVAQEFHCEEERVIFTPNSTEALNMAILGSLHRGDHVITTDLEHNSVLRPLHHLEQMGIITLSFVRADKKGRICYDDFEKLYQENTRAIVCTHGSNLTGNLIDLSRVGEFARSHQLLFIVDASQTAGVLDIDMEKWGIDLLCFTGHKSLMGPQGTGGLCIRGDIEVAPLKFGGTGIESYNQNQPDRYPAHLEAGTLNGHGIAGLLAAIEYIEKIGKDVIYQHEIELARAFYEGVTKIKGVTVLGDFSTWDRAPVVALNIEGYESGEVSDYLAQEYTIATRPGAHCAPRMHEALGTVETGAVRFSFSWHNTMEEVEIAIGAIRALVEQ